MVLLIPLIVATVTTQIENPTITLAAPLPGCCVNTENRCVPRAPIFPGGCPDGWTAILTPDGCPTDCGTPLMPTPTPVPTPEPTPIPTPAPTVTPTPVPTPHGPATRTFTLHFPDVPVADLYVLVRCAACTVRWGSDDVSVTSRWELRERIRGRAPSLRVFGVASVTVVQSFGGTVPSMTISVVE